VELLWNLAWILVFSWTIPLGIGGAIGITIHVVVLTIYLTGTARLRSSRHAGGSFFAGAWRNCGFQDSFAHVTKVIASQVFLGVFIGLALWYGGNEMNVPEPIDTSPPLSPTGEVVGTVIQVVVIGFVIIMVFPSRYF
jgi:hypothetical protein